MRENKEARRKVHSHVMTHPPPSQTNEYKVNADTVADTEDEMFVLNVDQNPKWVSLAQLLPPHEVGETRETLLTRY